MEDRRVSVRHIAAEVKLSVGSIKSTTLTWAKFRQDGSPECWLQNRRMFAERRHTKSCTSLTKIKRISLIVLLLKMKLWYPLWPWDQGWVFSVEISSISTKEVQGHQIIGQDHCVSLLGCIYRVHLVDFLEPGQTIDGDYSTIVYYASLCEGLRASIIKKRRGKFTKGVRLLHRTTRLHAHKSIGSPYKQSHQCGFELLPHPPYSLDPAPPTTISSQTWRNRLRGRVFNDDDETKAAVTKSVHKAEFFKEGLIISSSKCKTIRKVLKNSVFEKFACMQQGPLSRTERSKKCTCSNILDCVV